VGAAALCLATLPGAGAVDDDEDPYPSRERVRHAQERVASTADRVDAIEAALVAADRRLEMVSIEAGKAVEAYNGARYKLRHARKAARRAERTAERAAADVRRLQDQLSSSVVSGFENGGSLTSLGILINDPDPDALLEHLDAYAGVSGALQSDLDAYESAKVIADLLQSRAETALAEQEAATEAAEEAKEAAEAAVAEADAAVTSIAAEKDRLVHQLARLQDISVALARQRQQALARQAAEEAAKEAAAQAAAQAEQDQQAAQGQQKETDPPVEETDPPVEQTDPPTQEADPPADDTDPPTQEADPPVENPDPPVENPDPPTSNGSVGSNNVTHQAVSDPPQHTRPPRPHRARTAIRFAKAQLGEPYVYGAAGPSSWDCSGLTMKSWRRAGRSLSHWSVAQYYETTPISFSQLRRGDLLFWGDSSDPDSIYHVAMYLGNGRMIQAPRPGRSVEIVSIYYWILPNFYTRV
jgi:cell wall-associated NlpC family hydrolase